MVEKHLNITKEISYSILPSLLHGTHWHQINEIPAFSMCTKTKALGLYFVFIKMKLYSAYLISNPPRPQHFFLDFTPYKYLAT